MSGHSKWATIKHKKAAIDAKRGKAFTRIAKEISVAAKQSSDPNANPRLRHLIEKAREMNMPFDNINRAIKRGTGELPGVSYESHLYEGYGPHNVAVIVETLTDNKNRTVAEIRRLFTSAGGSLAEGGAVSWMFKKLGVIRTKEVTGISEDTMLEKLIDFDINDLQLDDNVFTIICEPQSLEKIKQTLVKENIAIESAELEWVAQNKLSLAEAEAQKAITFLEELEEHDDVQNVYANLE
ncbi:MAG: YebC/PmpR family DNA-binding transcriptional regulator [Candidatus Babeliales bacterium]